jgi:hypothetical protein
MLFMKISLILEQILYLAKQIYLSNFKKKLKKKKLKNKLGWNRFRPFMSPEEM